MRLYERSAGLLEWRVLCGGFGSVISLLETLVNVARPFTKAFPARAAGPRSISSSCARTPRASTADRNDVRRASGEFMPTPDVALSVRKITGAGSHAHRGEPRSQLRARAAGTR